ncbi:AraC family transcriptional regulator [Sansalvadorimonas sp. 2012CJ34-2]|uniref:AraC family transcriptional regulator n=1 Tax=Parendozoicomonas callyspongiae TaxID=2942213 RepID=A0ABT0PGG0_9GAMM|nr:AraC family transcriptional regulator [Sansalvadorimonas sp. 2012CJ34-2]MCL6269593.1 AraC family transcriptional regulator [Sansalvadorimonas sp. 2012CJ34-2]
MSELKDAGILVRMAHQGFLNAGIDTSAIYKRCGITRRHIEDRQIRTPHQAQALFWQAAEDVTGDRLIGLHLGEKMPVFGGQVIEYLFLSSPTFEEGLKRALNYQRLLSDAVMAHLDLSQNTCRFIIGGTRESKNLNHLADAILISALRFFKNITQEQFEPLKIYIWHRGYDVDHEYSRAFGCPVIFNAPYNAIEFDTRILKFRSSHAEPELMKAHEMLASEQIARLKKQDIVTKAERIIGEILDSGDVTLDTVSERMNMTARSLRSRLGETGTSFNQILSHYRCNLAKQLLARTNESIDEIVFLTGFSEPSTFYRAFKRWTGQTPVEYRKQKKASHQMEPTC